MKVLRRITFSDFFFGVYFYCQICLLYMWMYTTMNIHAAKLKVVKMIPRGCLF
jgi:hypothetical protein